MICKYIALFVADLRGAESAYRQLFDMDLLFREAGTGDDWATLPLEKGWEDADAAGIELTMVALRRDEFVLALFEGSPQPGTVHEGLFRTRSRRDRRRSGKTAKGMHATKPRTRIPSVR